MVLRFNFIFGLLDNQENNEMEIKKKIYDKRIVLCFPDNSIFLVEDKDKLSALKMKLKASNVSIKKFMSVFIEDVEKHWNNKTVPTKFPFDISWEEDLWDNIFDKYSKKYKKNKEEDIKEEVGKFTYITGRKNFERDVMEKNLKLVEDGVAIYTENSHDPNKILNKGNCIMTWDSIKGKNYEYIQNKYFRLVKKEADKEFIERKYEARIRFKNKADLAEVVFYQYIRSYLMGILLSKAQKKKRGSIVTSGDSISFVGKNFLFHNKFKEKNDE